MNAGIKMFADFDENPSGYPEESENHDWRCSLVPNPLLVGSNSKGYYIPSTHSGRASELRKFLENLKQCDIPAKEPASLELLVRLLKAGVRIINKPNGVNP
ncbi:MAG: hypothetical protein WBF04_07045 [Candidatus Sulfotelmatobacter sp.]